MTNLTPPIVFYLEHQDRIDEWAGLGNDARPLAHTFFSRLAQPLEARRAKLPGAPFLYVSLEEGCPKLFFARHNWRVADGGALRAGIGLEWVKNKTDFRSSYTGAWINLELAGGAELTKAVRLRLEPLVVGRSFNISRWFPASRVERPTREDYWLDLDGFAAELIDRICDRWRLMYEAVDEAVATADAGSSVERK